MTSVGRTPNFCRSSFRCEISNLLTSRVRPHQRQIQSSDFIQLEPKITTRRTPTRLLFTWWPTVKLFYLWRRERPRGNVNSDPPLSILPHGTSRILLENKPNKRVCVASFQHPNPSRKELLSMQRRGLTLGGEGTFKQCILVHHGNIQLYQYLQTVVC